MIERLKAKLNDGELLQKENDNRAYLMELDSSALLQNYYLEAGIGQVFGAKSMKHGGWEDPSCQLRGHFLGHYLSACAIRYDEVKDREIKAKADAIVHELAICQEENGGLWAAPIPEKYFTWIARGKAVWAPHYTVHKTFMGLLDMYRYADNEEALEVAKKFSLWFYDFTKDKTREEMDSILEFETGGMLEIWADLYEFTKDEMYLELISKYDRRKLFDPLIEGIDVLTNMHANTTIPEVLGCAKVYEVTGQERYRKVVESYWDLAVTQRGSFVTGGQTMGEIWTPPHSMEARLGEKNQEHCTVYNMMRLADVLFKWTGKAKYLDYIERNLYNGIMAQGYFRTGHTNGQTAEYPEEGLITYFLPMHAECRKGWGSKFNDFFCCHGSLVQANAAHNKFLYYQNGTVIYTGVYADSEMSFDVDGQEVTLKQHRDSLSGSFHSSSTCSAGHAVNEKTRIYQNHPDVRLQMMEFKMDSPCTFTLKLRKPEWAHQDPVLNINLEVVEYTVSEDGFVSIEREWKDGDLLSWAMPMDLYTCPLEGSEDMVAFSYGPYALAGITAEDRVLKVPAGVKEDEIAEKLFSHDTEREWGSWKDTFKTRYQDRGFRMVPIKDIGYEKYQMYFQIV